MVDDYSSRSFRLLAMAAGQVHGVSELGLGSMSLQQLEGWCNLHLLGLVVLSNHLRPESISTISELHDKYAGALVILVGFVLPVVPVGSVASALQDKYEVCHPECMQAGHAKRAIPHT